VRVSLLRCRQIMMCGAEVIIACSVYARKLIALAGMGTPFVRTDLSSLSTSKKLALSDLMPRGACVLILDIGGKSYCNRDTSGAYELPPVSGQACRDTRRRRPQIGLNGSLWVIFNECVSQKRGLDALTPDFCGLFARQVFHSAMPVAALDRLR